VVLYELTHGRLPYAAKNLDELRKKIKEENPSIRNDLHPDVAMILRGCLVKDPIHRMTTS